ncbi:hypothetical protein SAMN04488115_109120 [Bosea lathyri]|uniref:Uncharacterized protein n=1 Tax=Bosea lathyri TaxID=1036778 RepID=A0A1H6C8P1_9HYPH|nr:hypothetical protein SAMN04488115_109120 [Bosea lathyri]
MCAGKVALDGLGRQVTIGISSPNYEHNMSEAVSLGQRARQWHALQCLNLNPRFFKC